MALNLNYQLRLELGERVPEGGSDADTMFTNEEVDGWLARANDNLRAALFLAWSAKAGEYANLADVSEGNSLRNLSDLADHAEKRAASYLPDAQAAGLVEGARRAKIGIIQRSGGSIT